MAETKRHRVAGYTGRISGKRRRSSPSNRIFEIVSREGSEEKAKRWRVTERFNQDNCHRFITHRRSNMWMLRQLPNRVIEKRKRDNTFA